MLNKRIILSLKRRKSNLLIFIILVCIFVLFLISISIYKAASENITEIEKTYGNSFKIKMIRDESNPALWEERTIATGFSFKAYIGPDIDMKMLERIAQTDGIKEFETGRDCYILLLGYQLTNGGYHYCYLDILENPDDIVTAEDYENMQYMSRAYPTRNSIYHQEFYNGNVRIAEGRHITSNDRYKSIVSKTFAEKNRLKLGDTLKVGANSLVLGTGYPAESVGDVETEIVGLFETTYQQPITEYTNEDDIINNWVFVDTQTGLELNAFLGYENKLSSGYFFVENPSEINRIMNEVQAIDEIDWSYYALEKNASVYSNAIAPLKTIRILMAVILILISLAGICLLFLTVTHSIKGRTRETGILMSVGISAQNIRQQFILEHILLGIAAYICALLLGLTAAPALGNQLYGMMSRDSEEKFYTKEEMEAAYIAGEADMDVLAKNQRTGIAVQESINTNVSVESAVFVLVTELLIIYICVDTAIKKTLKLEPIKVLSMIQ